MPKTVRQPADGISTAVIRRILAAEEGAQTRVHACRQRAQAAAANAQATARRIEAVAMQRIQRIQLITGRMQQHNIETLRLKEKRQAKKLSTFKPSQKAREDALHALSRHLLGLKVRTTVLDRER